VKPLTDVLQFKQFVGGSNGPFGLPSPSLPAPPSVLAIIVPVELDPVFGSPSGDSEPSSDTMSGWLALLLRPDSVDSELKGI
jgi:hypothetical protein